MLPFQFEEPAPAPPQSGVLPFEFDEPESDVMPFEFEETPLRLPNAGDALPFIPASVSGILALLAGLSLRRMGGRRED